MTDALVSKIESGATEFTADEWGQMTDTLKNEIKADIAEQAAHDAEMAELDALLNSPLPTI